MKRLWACLLVFLLTAAWVGCKKPSEPTETVPSPTATVVTVEVSPAFDFPAPATVEPNEAAPTAEPPVYSGHFVLPQGWSYFAEKHVPYFSGDGTVTVMQTEIGKTAVTYLDLTAEQWQKNYEDAGMDADIVSVERTVINGYEASVVRRSEADGTLADLYLFWTEDMTYLFTVTSANGEAGLTEARQMMDTFLP